MVRCLAIFLFAVLSTPATSAERAVIQRGEALLTKHCGACHAVGRTGSSQQREAPALRTLGQRYPVESLEEALAEGLITGHPDMPEFSFSPADVGAVIEYLKSIQVK